MSAQDIIINLINIQKEKEEKNNIWIDSPYKDLIKLQSNNIGIIGEKFIEELCKINEIKVKIDGSKTKKIGGGYGDGKIKDKYIEIKTAHQTSKNSLFQHELGETPWKSDYIIFVDIAPYNIYITIFKNFNEEHYKNKINCEPYFPSKIITWRKNSGAFKLDTSVKINETNIVNKYTIKITEITKNIEIKDFINNSIK